MRPFDVICRLFWNLWLILFEIPKEKYFFFFSSDTECNRSQINNCKQWRNCSPNKKCSCRGNLIVYGLRTIVTELSDTTTLRVKHCLDKAYFNIEGWLERILWWHVGRSNNFLIEKSYLEHDANHVKICLLQRGS